MGRQMGGGETACRAPGSRVMSTLWFGPARPSQPWSGGLMFIHVEDEDLRSLIRRQHFYSAITALAVTVTHLKLSRGSLAAAARSVAACPCD